MYIAGHKERVARDLRGKRIGILENSKPNADVLLGRVAELALRASITR